MRAIRYWIPVFLWMGVIFWMSTGTFSQENTSYIIEPIIRFLMPSLTSWKVALIHAAVRKLGHVTEYFILGTLLLRAFRSGSKEVLNPRWALYSVLIVILYAAGDEFHQSFVSERTASFIDVGFDTLGGILAQIAALTCQLGRR